MAPIDISTFASRQLTLLDRELQSELAETALLASASSPAALQRAGLAILNLHVASQRTGLGGKTVLDLQLDPAIGSGELPEHGLRVGDIVGLRERVAGAAKKREKAEAEGKGIDGVLVKVAREGVALALAGEDVEVPGNGSGLWM